MADGTQGGNTAGPDLIWTEDVGSASGKIPRGKVVLGALDTDGGDWNGTVTIAAKVTKFLLGSEITLLSTELNALANNALVASSVLHSTGIFDNTVGGADGDGYTLCDVELFMPSMGGAATANTSITVWFLQTQDGTSYEDGSASITPARNADVTFPLRAVSTAQRVIRRVWIPWGKFMILALNNGTGQSMAATLNTLRIRPVTPESV